MTRLKRSNFPGLLLAAPLLFSCAGPTNSPPPSQLMDEQSLGQFVHDPTAASWQQLESTAENDRESKSNQMVLAMSRFSEAVIARDLPNSMAQDGDPSEHQRILAADAEKRFAELRCFVSEDLWNLTIALLLQDFDDTYHGACAEVVVRLFPSRYQALKEYVTEDRARLLYDAYLKSVQSEPAEEDKGTPLIEYQ
jgi:hypothetical protein